MSSNASKKNRARRSGARTSAAPAGTMGLVDADEVARQLFGALGRARYTKAFPASDRFQIGLRQRTRNGLDGFGVIGSGRTWEIAIADARARMADAVQRAAREAAARQEQPPTPITEVPVDAIA